MLVSAGAIENLSYQSQDIDCRNHDGAACNDRPHAVERIGMLERTGEDGHFGNETAESGQSQIGKTGDYIADSQKGIIFIRPESSRTSRVWVRPYIIPIRAKNKAVISP